MNVATANTEQLNEYITEQIFNGCYHRYTTRGIFPFSKISCTKCGRSISAKKYREFEQVDFCSILAPRLALIRVLNKLSALAEDSHTEFFPEKQHWFDSPTVIARYCVDWHQKYMWKALSWNKEEEN